VLELGALVMGERGDATAKVCVPLPMVNRHGLVAGATAAGREIVRSISGTAGERR